MAERFGVRPCVYYGFLDPYSRLALDFDRAIHLRLIAWDQHCADEQNKAIKENSV